LRVFARHVGGLGESEATDPPAALGIILPVLLAAAAFGIGVLVGMDLPAYTRSRRARENWMRAGMPPVRPGTTPEEWECEWAVRRR
jgi:hypothetical protein